MYKKLLILAVLFLVIFQYNLYSQDKADVKYWIIFKGKGEFSPKDIITKDSKAYNKGKELLTDKAIKRRLKVLSPEKLIDFSDIPLHEAYINRITKTGIGIIAKSKWANGVSAYMTKKQLEEVKKLDFVGQIKTVNKLYKQEIKNLSPVEAGDYFENKVFVKPLDSNNVYDYGKSYDQLWLIDVPKVHNLGIIGKGVLVASFDDGFHWKTHEALKDLNITDEYDFVNKDKVTSNELNQKYEDTQLQGGHGTSTLSSMGGFKEGKLIGPAFGSEFILAKTEYTATETPMEEDFWLEAAEWAEAKGVDVITSSLVYKVYDDPYKVNSYEYENFNGRTAITTLAAVRCAYLGVVVLNAMGNYFQTAIPSLGSAADGDSILSIGAVMNNGEIASFSSNGPTSDGRTKPDVCAQGVYVYVATKDGSSKYEYSNGTSFSTPITAGVCALILSAHPELTPIQVREALRMTASNYSSPNNILGWGVINAYNALLYFGMVWSNETKFKDYKNYYTVETSLASKYLIDINSVKMVYSTGSGESFNEAKMNYLSGNNDGNYSGKYTCDLDNVKSGTSISYYFYAKDMNGNESVYPKGADKNADVCLKVKL